MRLTLSGHDYKYAVEQMMLALFPDERPEYAGSASRMSALSSLSIGRVYAQSVTVLSDGDRLLRGTARVRREKLGDKLETDRILQRLVKQSFYRAAVCLLPAPPPWGSLTGIRPAKLAESMLESGESEKSASNRLRREYYVSSDRAKLCVQSASSALNIKKSLGPRDIALYIGIPFCPTRCAYCSFVSGSVEKSFDLIGPFTGALISEIDEISKAVNELGLRVISVYIGGGTPTALPPRELESVMSGLDRAFDLSHVREYTVEAGRPDTITAEKLEIIQRRGATRVSVNPQSLSADVLRAIGRNHSPHDVFEAVGLVRDTGALRLNMDVIAGLPSDTLSGFQNTLDTVIGMSPENITVHTLSLKKGSRIMLEGTPIPGGAEVSYMLDYASRKLYDAGYSPYYLYRQKFTSGGFENIGWTQSGHENLYNVCMMEELCTVIALGGGGVTKLVSGSGKIERVFNVKYPREYTLCNAEKIIGKVNAIKNFCGMEAAYGIQS